MTNAIFCPTGLSDSMGDALSNVVVENQVRGYRAFSIPAEVVCEQLGAVDTTRRQLALAFELGRKRISQNIEKCSAANAGERIALRTLDA